MSLKPAAGIASLGCAFYLFLILLGIGIAYFCGDYIIYSFFAKDLHWFVDIVVGLVGNGLTIPVTVICWVLRLCGMEPPFFDIN